MNKKEFASQIRVREKKYVHGYVIGLSLVGFWMISGPVLDHFYNLNQSKVLLNAWAAAGIIVILVLCAALLVYGSRRGVPCRHCGKRLFAIPGQIAVATGNCGYCGEKAFE